MTKFRCSNCGTIVEDHQVKCHSCGAVFGDGNLGTKAIGNILGALTGNRPLDEIKEDWIFELRKAIVGGTQKTFGVDNDGTDNFKKPKVLPKTSKPIIDADFEIIDADFEVVDTEFEVVEETKTRFKEAQKMENLPKHIQNALKKRMGVEEDEPTDNGE
jgi:hypothetical protein